jgi:hypothetical protein
MEVAGEVRGNSCDLPVILKIPTGSCKILSPNIAGLIFYGAVRQKSTRAHYSWPNSPVMTIEWLVQLRLVSLPIEYHQNPG